MSFINFSIDILKLQNVGNEIKLTVLDFTCVTLNQALV